MDNGAVKREAKHSQNVTHTSILTGDPDTLVLERVVPPELHLMLGSNNFLMLYHISYIGIALKIVNELKQKCFNSKKTAEGFMAEFYREVYYSYKE